MNNKELIQTIPSSWDELTLSQFERILDITPITDERQVNDILAKVNNSVKLLSAITGRTEDEIASMDISTVSAMAERLNFMLTEPDKKGKTSIKWKQIDKVTYNEYITFLTLSQDPLHNLPELIKTFSALQLSEEEILNLSMQEVHVGFFTLIQHVRRYVRHLVIRRSLKYLVREIPKQIVIATKLKLRSKRKR